MCVSKSQNLHLYIFLGEPGVSLEAVQDRLARDMVIGTDAVNGKDAQRRLQFCRCADGPRERFPTCSGSQGELVGGCGRLELGAVLLGEGAGDQPPENVAEHESADATIGFLERHQAPEPERGQDWGRDSRGGEEVGGVGEVAAIVIRGEEDAKVLHGHSGRAGCRATPPGAEVSEEPPLIQASRRGWISAEEGGVDRDVGCLGPVLGVAQFSQGGGGQGREGASGERRARG